MKKYFGNRETIFLPARKKAEASGALCARTTKPLKGAGSVKMITDSKKVLTLAALIVATGIATVELTRSPAQADPMLVADGAYVSARVDTVFEVVAQMPEAPAVMVPMAEKGDLLVPQGCEGAYEAECMDVAYETESVPSVVIETRTDAVSTLMRVDGMTVAGIDEITQSSE